MKTFYVGLDLGSSSFQQAAINGDGGMTMNRSFDQRSELARRVCGSAR